MKKFTDDLTIQDKLEELLRLHKHYVMENMEESDPMVDGQKTRLYKFWCWLKYGHLLNKSGVCRRCGKVLEVKK